MINGYLGVDIGSVSTKGVIIDKNSNILAKSYIYTKGNPITAVKELINILHKETKKQKRNKSKDYLLK